MDINFYATEYLRGNCGRNSVSWERHNNRAVFEGILYRSNDGITTALLSKDTAQFKVKSLLILNVL
jgi:hypothetical protein